MDPDVLSKVDWILTRLEDRRIELDGQLCEAEKKARHLVCELRNVDNVISSFRSTKEKS